MYYKSKELATLYGVSRRTVTNWIEQTLKGRLQLELIKIDEQFYIAQSLFNQTMLLTLVNERRKFLNHKSLKHVSPTERFYTLYSERQILDIIHNLENYRDIPRQYNYFAEGADYWNTHIHNLLAQSSPNILNATTSLLETHLQYLGKLLEPYSRVNILDIGVGNALPVRGILEFLATSKKLGSYTAIDTSERMLAIAKSNLRQWFGDELQIESYSRDIRFERFGDVIKRVPRQEKTTVNLVLFLGALLINHRDPYEVLQVFRESMLYNDILIYTSATNLGAPDRRNVYTVSSTVSNPIPMMYRFILDELNIDPSLYTVEIGFDEKESARYLKVKLKHAVSIEFKLKKGSWVVDLNKDDSIQLLYARSETAFDVANQFQARGFNPLLLSKTDDNHFMLLISNLQKVL